MCPCSRPLACIGEALIRTRSLPSSISPLAAAHHDCLVGEFILQAKAVPCSAQHRPKALCCLLIRPCSHMALHAMKCSLSF